MDEILFNANCELCERENTPCRNHHLIQQRLLKTLTFRKQKQWKFMTVRICNSCNGYVHPENKLYKQIAYLKTQLGYKLTEEEINANENI